MSPLVIKIIGSTIMAISTFYIVRNLVGSKEKLRENWNIIPILCIIVLPCWFYEVKYNFLVTILFYIISIIVIKKIFKISFTTSILACTMFMILTALTDAIISSVETLFLTYEQLRNIWYINISNNLGICGIAILLSRVPIIKNNFQKFSAKIDSHKKLSGLFFSIMTVLVLILLFYNITTIFELNSAMTITLGCMVILIILYYVYIEERNNYEKLNDEYNNLFDYIQNFENWIDDEQMYRHELKNNLSSIRGMTKEQKVKQKIDEMLKISIQVDEHYVEQLKYVPKGGLKGILYYKIAIAKNAKVRMITELSEKVTERLNELENDEIRCLSILIGIYLDNAIEAASVSKKKTVTLEMYMVEENLRIVISNSYKEKVPLKEMTAKGFTTKGEGRGRGLHYAEKVINKRKNFSAEKRFLNDYFIEQVTITPSYKSKKKG